ncbi:hypothetical protein HDV05_001695 [Chytridiales sp. JEL 0842]|nr:hypothetical protein HDV05_001695 [Chytridiales sp. JEL 0842]
MCNWDYHAIESECGITSEPVLKLVISGPNFQNANWLRTDPPKIIFEGKAFCAYCQEVVDNHQLRGSTGTKTCRTTEMPWDKANMNSVMTEINMNKDLNKELPRMKTIDIKGYIRSKHCNAFSFDNDLLPYMISTANSPTLRKVYDDQDAESLLLKQGVEGKLTFGSGEILCLLANAFFLNVSSHPQAGNIHLGHWYFTLASEGIERLKCLLAYFYQCYVSHQSGPNDVNLNDRKVCFERIVYNIDEAMSKAETDQRRIMSPNTQVVVTPDRMESSCSDAFVDFANKDIHIHKVIPSCTQEEVLFSVVPECYLAILLFPRLEPNEVALIHNVARVCDYTGYLDTFKFERILETQQLQTIIVIDATHTKHFQSGMVTRDISKAFMGFSSCLKSSCLSIATGHWGCGVFGGNKYHKFLQQILAFAMATSTFSKSDSEKPFVLHYSCFNDTDLVKEFEGWLDFLARRQISVQQLCTWLVGYDIATNKDSFKTYMDKLLLVST